MHIVVMNNDKFVATHPRTIVQYTMKCKITTKIYIVCKLNTLIYVHHVIFLLWTLCSIFFLLGVLFYLYLVLFVVSRNKYFFEMRFVS